ncbi:hypothetical protein THIAE_06210 [Thiomicrospira aerophila AL3]|uniref:Uncharacterized protein n=1 Tax=Thiomicrospira aerophila AL3 TaxID=717772 RepID=W0DZ95_9GAMM|nr:hypothetical protein [Thiomicrospira aerophila]AHF02304.1 hypothetical protein THIAE_06210 [Thiomicrospira aerophila AL3]
MLKIMYVYCNQLDHEVEVSHLNGSFTDFEDFKLRGHAFIGGLFFNDILEFSLKNLSAEAFKTVEYVMDGAVIATQKECQLSADYVLVQEGTVALVSFRLDVATDSQKDIDDSIDYMISPPNWRSSVNLEKRVHVTKHNLPMFI